MLGILKMLKITLLTTLAFTSLLLYAQESTKAGNIPSESLLSQSIEFEYAIYYLPVASTEPKLALKKNLQNEKNSPKLVNKIPKKIKEFVMSGYLNNDVKMNYAPPSLTSLKHFGRGLSREQGEKLQLSSQAYIMDFACDRIHRSEGLLKANKIAEAIARETGGLIWDEVTREVFSPDEWHKRRIQNEAGEIVKVENHITLHMYQNGEYCRAITLGMEKFGLPDVVINNIPRSNIKLIFYLINSYCQLLIEGAVANEASEFELDLKKIQHKEFRETMLGSMKSNGTGIAQLLLKQGKWEEGDPKNRLIEILFDKYEGSDVFARQDKLLSSLFGKKDEVSKVTHNDEILAASNKAKANLPKMYEEFVKGLKPGEYILVKAPFKTPNDGNEWMWVEITRWDKDNIKGTLQNEPFHVPSLHAGQEVNIKQQDIFDYIRYFQDGTKEGGETTAIILKQEEEQKK